MATRKRLNRMTEGHEIDVNLDTIRHMQRFKDHTILHFSASDGGKIYTLYVKETPDEIHSRPPHAARE